MNLDKFEKIINEAFEIKEKINITASDYPGEIVKHSDHYFISLRDGDSFSWFLLK